jgi:hypothetical protein
MKKTKKTRKTKKTKKTLAKRTRERPAPDVEPRFGPVVAAFTGDRRVSRKRMFSSSNVLTVNGKIFAMLVKGPSISHSNFNTTTVASSGSIPLALRETSSSKRLQTGATVEYVGEAPRRCIVRGEWIGRIVAWL